MFLSWLDLWLHVLDWNLGELFNSSFLSGKILNFPSKTPLPGVNALAIRLKFIADKAGEVVQWVKATKPDDLMT